MSALTELRLQKRIAIIKPHNRLTISRDPISP
jgi:hypothetical protein